MSREHRISAALRRLLKAVEALGQVEPVSRLTHFEASVLKSADTRARWKELHDARMEAMSALAD